MCLIFNQTTWYPMIFRKDLLRMLAICIYTFTTWRPTGDSNTKQMDILPKSHVINFQIDSQHGAQPCVNKHPRHKPWIEFQSTQRLYS